MFDMFEYKFLKEYEGKKVHCTLQKYGQFAYGILTSVDQDNLDNVWLHIEFKDGRKTSFLSKELRAIREEK